MFRYQGVAIVWCNVWGHSNNYNVYRRRILLLWSGSRHNLHVVFCEGTAITINIITFIVGAFCYGGVATDIICVLCYDTAITFIVDTFRCWGLADLTVLCCTVLRHSNNRGCIPLRRYTRMPSLRADPLSLRPLPGPDQAILTTHLLQLCLYLFSLWFLFCCVKMSTFITSNPLLGSRFTFLVLLSDFFWGGGGYYFAIVCSYHVKQCIKDMSYEQTHQHTRLFVVI